MPACFKCYLLLPARLRARCNFADIRASQEQRLALAEDQDQALVNMHEKMDSCKPSCHVTSFSWLLRCLESFGPVYPTLPLLMAASIINQSHAGTSRFLVVPKIRDEMLQMSWNNCFGKTAFHYGPTIIIIIATFAGLFFGSKRPCCRKPKPQVLELRNIA